MILRRFLTIGLICTPLFLLYANDTKQLTLERSARVLASYLLSLNPNEDLFKAVENVPAIYPKDLFDKSVEIEINEKHAIEEPLREKAIIVKGFEGLSAFLERRQLSITTSTLGACTDTCCNYPTLHGISHNHIYLHEACFVFKKNKAYLKSILFYNGD